MAPPGIFSACPHRYEYVDAKGNALKGASLAKKHEALLGSGAHGATFRMRNTADGVIYAAKVIGLLGAVSER